MILSVRYLPRDVSDVSLCFNKTVAKYPTYGCFLMGEKEKRYGEFLCHNSDAAVHKLSVCVSDR